MHQHALVHQHPPRTRVRAAGASSSSMRPLPVTAVRRRLGAPKQSPVAARAGSDDPERKFGTEESQQVRPPALIAP
jgi:hypothetical protein